MVVVMFGVAGTGYNVVRRLAEDGKVRPSPQPIPITHYHSYHPFFPPLLTPPLFLLMWSDG